MASINFINQYTRHQILFILAVTLMSLVSSVTVTRNSWALSCSSPPQPQEIKSKLDNFKVLVKTQSEHTIHEIVTALQDPNLCVRVGAADALKSIGTGAEDSIHELIAIVEDKNQNVELRKTAALALRSIDAEPALDTLIRVLQDKTDDYGVRIDVAGALESLGLKAKKAVPTLLDTIKNDWYGDVRQSAVKAIGAVKTDSDNFNIVLALNDTLENDIAWTVRKEAASILGNIADENKQANDSKLRAALKNSVPYLRDELKNKNYTSRSLIAGALGKIGADAKDVIPDLRQALQDSNKYVRKAAASSLGAIGANDQESISKLNELLSDNVPLVREQAAKVLGQMSVNDETSVNNLTKTLEDPNLEVRTAAIYALRNIASNLPENVKNKTLTTKKAQGYLDNTLNKLKQNLSESKDLQNTEKDAYKGAINDIEQHRKSIQTTSIKIWLTSVFQFLNNPLDYGILGAIIISIDIFLIYFVFQVVLHIIYLILYWVRPLWLPKFDKILPDGITVPKLDTNIGIKPIFFNVYGLKVLDAWVSTYIASARDKFPQKTTVQERRIHVPIPVRIDSHLVKRLTSKMLRSIFDKHKCLLIWGEGGLGKTSLACQIAKWAMSDQENERLQKHKMLPILIQEDLDLTKDQSFINAIRGQLQDLIGESHPIDCRLLEELLKNKRILVIVDSFSEMNQETRQLIRPENADFLIAALIITSRNEETLGHITKGVIKTLRIHGTDLAYFLDTYLSMQHRRDHFSHQEFFHDCHILYSMKDQEPELTAMLVKLYAERLIEAKNKGESPERLCISMPQLILDYLNKLNENIPKENRLINNSVLQTDAKSIAWECLKGDYQPTIAKKKDVINALIKLNMKEITPESRLQYLEDSLGLIITVEPEEDEIRFDLNLLTEYLAALHLLENYEKNKIEWEKIEQKISKIPDSFLIAIQSCCSHLITIPEELSKIRNEIDKEIQKRT